MLVHFYEIRGCTCDNVDNRPVLVAPDYCPLEQLTHYQFVLLEDGRWVHFLTSQEYAYVMTGYSHRDVVFSTLPESVLTDLNIPEDPSRGNIFGGLGLGLFVGSIAACILIGFLLRALDEDQSIIIIQAAAYLPLVLEIGSFAMMLYTRIRYPKNILGKVLMWLFIVEAVLIVIALIAAVIACIACANQCITSIKDCPG